MQAFLPAAGLGTRLRPFTNDRPKALVEVQGRTLLELAIGRLTRLGVSRIVVNVHHYADQVEAFLHSRDWDTEVRVSDERAQLMDTGGGLKQAASLFAPDEPILIHNVDILSHIDLGMMVRQHIDSMSFATLAASRRDTSRQLLFDSRGQLVGWTNRSNGEYRWSRQPVDDCEALAFSGIAIVDPQLLGCLPAATHPYSIIPAYLDIAKNHRISYFLHTAADWLDVGKTESLNQAQQWKLS